MFQNTWLLHCPFLGCLAPFDACLLRYFSRSASFTVCSLPETWEAKQAPVNRFLHFLYGFDGTAEMPLMRREDIQL
jgi:hypothetical protein